MADIEKTEKTEVTEATAPAKTEKKAVTAGQTIKNRYSSTIPDRRYKTIIAFRFRF